MTTALENPLHKPVARCGAIRIGGRDVECAAAGWRRFGQADREREDRAAGIAFALLDTGDRRLLRTTSTTGFPARAGRLDRADIRYRRG